VTRIPDSVFAIHKNTLFTHETKDS
jgi:hypothetical protein